MEKLILLFIVLIGLILLINWRLSKAETRIEGKTAPEAIKSGPSHPDGVLYYFYQPSCGPCRKMEPTINQLSEKYPGRVVKHNVTHNLELAKEVGIILTPTMVYVKNNKIIKALIGSKPDKVVEDILMPPAS